MMNESYTPCLVLSNYLFNIAAPCVDKLNNMESSYTRLLIAARELGKGKNAAEVARLLEVSDQTIQNWKTRGVPDSKLVMIEERIGASPKWLATGQGEMVKRPQIDATNLTEEQKQVLLLMEGIRKDARETWIKMGGHLSGQVPERRKEDLGHSPERRLGGQKYKDGHDMSGYEEKTHGKPNEQSQKRRKND
jgi:Bacteriophage CI repressor helix-turn-helix domain.